MDSLEYAMQGREPAVRTHGPRERRAGRHAARVSAEPIPLARPDVGAARGGAGAARCCAPAACRSGRCSTASSSDFARLARAPRRGRGLERHRRAAPRRARARLGTGRRGRHEPAQLRGVRQLHALRGREAGLLRHRPAHAEHGSAGRRGGLRRAYRGAAAGAHLRLPGRHGARSRSSRAPRGLGIVEDACEALGAVDADGVRVGARGHPAAFGFYANKQLVTGEGGMLTSRRRRGARAGAQRAQPGARRATWTGSRTTASASTTGCPT